jgi:hypothetical protein
MEAAMAKFKALFRRSMDSLFESLFSWRLVVRSIEWTAYSGRMVCELWFRRILKKAVVVYFKLPYRNLSVRIPKKILTYNPKRKRNMGHPPLKWRDHHTLVEDGTENVWPNQWRRRRRWWWWWWWWQLLFDTSTSPTDIPLVTWRCGKGRMRRASRKMSIKAGATRAHKMRPL